ncbi:MAG TPA: tripartite tricarboxylate transporter substrate-binding protein, partial [Usitatibacter sp.]
NPGKANIGTVNIGSTQNLAGELFKASAGVDAQIVPFNGTPALMSAVLGGSVDVAIEILGPVMPQVAAKSMRVLALMGDKRREGLPGVPTVQESGIANFSVSSWNALAAPARTPPDIVAYLSREAHAAVNSPAVKARLAELGVDARSSTPQEARALLTSEMRRWADVIDKAGIEKQ